jgi:alpha-beta hydrolase superfamily lysophospholipase
VRIPSRTRVTGWAAALIFTCLWAGAAGAQGAYGGLPRHALLGAGAADARGGVGINFVRPASPADRAGLRVGDVVTAIGGQPVGDAQGFVAEVKSQAAGRPIPFEIRRGGASVTLPVVLDAAPDEHDPRVVTAYEAITMDDSLRRTLVTSPAGAHGRHPAVLIIGGIGCYSVDVAADPEDAYLRLAHDLSARGFVVMRLEKSGVGDSQGPPCATVDLTTEMRSYALALVALTHHPLVDSAHVYLVGHSIGSAIAPRLAASPPIAGVVVLEGFGRNWFEYELANLRRQLELGGDPPGVVDAKLAEKEICMHRFLIAREPEAEIEKTEPFCRVHDVYPAAPDYLRQAAALNIAEPWTRLAAPVLAIYGTGDFVTAEADHRRIVDIVNAAHAGSATLTLIPGMDHHLDVAGTPQQAWDLRVRDHRSGPYEPRLSAALLEWLCARERCPAA